MEQLVADAHRPYSHPEPLPPCSSRVVLACEPALLAIAGALRDQRQPVSRVALNDLKTFVTDGVASALFGADRFAAHRSAEELRRSFTGHPDIV